MDRNKWASLEKLQNVVFGYDVLYHQLQVFASKEDAIAAVEGLTITEGDYLFFASDGYPLEAIFSVKPQVHVGKNTYSNGKYTLEATTNRVNLRALLAIVECDDHAQSGLSTLRDVQQFLIDRSLE